MSERDPSSSSSHAPFVPGSVSWKTNSANALPMSRSQRQHSLAYGDSISFYTQVRSSFAMESIRGQTLFIQSRRVVDRCGVKSSSSTLPSTASFTAALLENSITAVASSRRGVPPSFEVCLFELCPSQRSTATRLLRTLCQENGLTFPSENVVISQRAREEWLDYVSFNSKNNSILVERVRSALFDFILEEKQNRLQLDRFLGKPIHFGDEVMLRHIESRCFVEVSEHIAQTSILGFRLELVDEGSPRCLLSLVSADGSGGIGSPIILTPEHPPVLYIRSMVDASTIHVGSSFDESSLLPDLLEVFSSSAEATSWNIALYETRGERCGNMFLHAGSRIMFRHNVRGGVLRSNPFNEKYSFSREDSFRTHGLPSNYGGDALGKEDPLSLNVDRPSVALSLPAEKDIVSMPSPNALWEIEMLIPRDGGIIRWGYFYRVRHSPSGLYLAGIPVEQNVRVSSQSLTRSRDSTFSSLQFKFILSTIDHPNNIFVLHPTSATKSEGVLTRDHFALMLVYEEKRFMVKVRESIENNSYMEPSEMGFYSISRDPERMEVYADELISERDSFQLIYPRYGILQDIDYALLLTAPIHEFVCRQDEIRRMLQSIEMDLCSTNPSENRGEKNVPSEDLASNRRDSAFMSNEVLLKQVDNEFSEPFLPFEESGSGSNGPRRASSHFYHRFSLAPKRTGESCVEVERRKTFEMLPVFRPDLAFVVDRMQRALQLLFTFLFGDSDDLHESTSGQDARSYVSARQKLLRSFGILKDLIGVDRQSLPNPTLLFQCLRRSVEDCPLNRVILAKNLNAYLDWISDDNKTAFSILPFVTEVVRDEPEILQHLSVSVVDRFISLYKEACDSSRRNSLIQPESHTSVAKSNFSRNDQVLLQTMWMEFFSTLCSCNRNPLGTYQTLFLLRLVHGWEMSPAHADTNDIDSKAFGVLVPGTGFFSDADVDAIATITEALMDDETSSTLSISNLELEPSRFILHGVKRYLPAVQGLHEYLLRFQDNSVINGDADKESDAGSVSVVSEGSHKDPFLKFLIAQGFIAGALISSNPNLYRFELAQIRFLSQIAKGRNYYALRLFSRLFPCNALSVTILEPRWVQTPEFRAAFIDLFRNVFVDTAECSKNIHTTKIWDCLKDDDFQYMRSIFDNGSSLISNVCFLSSTRTEGESIAREKISREIQTVLSDDASVLGLLLSTFRMHMSIGLFCDVNARSLLLFDYRSLSNEPVQVSPTTSRKSIPWNLPLCHFLKTLETILETQLLNLSRRFLFHSSPQDYHVHLASLEMIFSILRSGIVSFPSLQTIYYHISSVFLDPSQEILFERFSSSSSHIAVLSECFAMALKILSWVFDVRLNIRLSILLSKLRKNTIRSDFSTQPQVVLEHLRHSNFSLFEDPLDDWKEIVKMTAFSDERRLMSSLGLSLRALLNHRDISARITSLQFLGRLLSPVDEIVNIIPQVRILQMRSSGDIYDQLSLDVHALSLVSNFAHPSVTLIRHVLSCLLSILRVFSRCKSLEDLGELQDIARDLQLLEHSCGILKKFSSMVTISIGPSLVPLDSTMPLKQVRVDTAASEISQYFGSDFEILAAELNQIQSLEELEGFLELTTSVELLFVAVDIVYRLLTLFLCENRSNAVLAGEHLELFFQHLGNLDSVPIMLRFLLPENEVALSNIHFRHVNQLLHLALLKQESEAKSGFYFMRALQGIISTRLSYTPFERDDRLKRSLLAMKETCIQMIFESLVSQMTTISNILNSFPWETVSSLTLSSNDYAHSRDLYFFASLLDIFSLYEAISVNSMMKYYHRILPAGRCMQYYSFFCSMESSTDLDSKNPHRCLSILQAKISVLSFIRQVYLAQQHRIEILYETMSEDVKSFCSNVLQDAHKNHLILTNSLTAHSPPRNSNASSNSKTTGSIPKAGVSSLMHQHSPFADPVSIPGLILRDHSFGSSDSQSEDHDVPIGALLATEASEHELIELYHSDIQGGGKAGTGESIRVSGVTSVSPNSIDLSMSSWSSYLYVRDTVLPVLTVLEERILESSGSLVSEVISFDSIHRIRDTLLELVARYRTDSPSSWLSSATGSSRLLSWDFFGHSPSLLLGPQFLRHSPMHADQPNSEPYQSLMSYFYSAMCFDSSTLKDVNQLSYVLDRFDTIEALVSMIRSLRWNDVVDLKMQQFCMHAVDLFCHLLKHSENRMVSQSRYFSDLVRVGFVDMLLHLLSFGIPCILESSLRCLITCLRSPHGIIFQQALSDAFSSLSWELCVQELSSILRKALRDVSGKQSSEDDSFVDKAFDEEVCDPSSVSPFVQSSRLIAEFLTDLAESNRVMQNFLRRQFGHAISYNVVSDLSKLAVTLERRATPSLDTLLLSVLECLTSICASNTENQLCALDVGCFASANRLLKRDSFSSSNDMLHLRIAAGTFLLQPFEGQKDKQVMSLLCTALQVDMLEHELAILHKNLALSFEFSHLESRIYQVRGSYSTFSSPGIDWKIPEDIFQSEVHRNDIGKQILRYKNLGNERVLLQLRLGITLYRISMYLIDMLGMDKDRLISVFSHRKHVSLSDMFSVSDTKDPDSVFLELRARFRTRFFIFSSCIGRVEVGIGSSSEDIEMYYYELPTDCFFLPSSTKEEFSYYVDRSSSENRLRELVRSAEPLRKDMLFQRFLRNHPVLNFFAEFRQFVYWILFLIAISINLLLFSGLRVTERTDTSYASGMSPIVSGAVFLLGILQIVIASFMFIFVTLQHAYLSKSFHVFHEESDESMKPVAFLLSFAKFVSELFMSSGWMHEFVYLGLAVVGLIWTPLVYTFHLLDIIPRSKVLQEVVKAVSKNIWSLFLTLLLGLVFVYGFSIFIFVHFNNNMKIKDDDGVTLEFSCTTLYGCMGSMLNVGLRQSGWFEELYGEDLNTSLLWIVLSVAFHLIVLTIGLNIAFGIILDTFAELRSARDQRQDEQKNVCFICSLRRDKFGHKFNEHIHHEHNMWEWLYFLVFLLHPYRKLNFTERYILSLIHRDRIDFFPQGNAVSLQNASSLQFVQDDNEEKVDLPEDVLVDELASVYNSPLEGGEMDVVQDGSQKKHPSGSLKQASMIRSVLQTLRDFSRRFSSPSNATG